MTCDEAIRRIRAALRRRSGKAWSVTGGRGTSYGWIRIDAPPARRRWHDLPRPRSQATGAEVYEEVEGGPGGHASPADRAELAALLGLDAAHFQGVSIPASIDYREEYVARAEGHEPEVLGNPYWD